MGYLYMKGKNVCVCELSYDELLTNPLWEASSFVLFLEQVWAPLGLEMGSADECLETYLDPYLGFPAHLYRNLGIV